MTYDLNTPSAARLWTWQPDWSGGYEVRRAFRTDIITSRSGKEQRRALRDVARLAVRYRTVAAEDELRAARHFLRAWQANPTAIPDFSRCTVLTGASSGGATTLTIASPPTWVAAGQLLVLCGATGTELVEVESVGGSTITLADPLASAWGSGSIVRPGLFGLLDASVRSSRFRRGASEIDVSLAVYPGGEPPEDEGAAETTFNGSEVFTAQPDWSGRPALDYVWPVEQIDFGIGRTAQFRPITRPETLSEAGFNGLTASAAASIEQAFLRAKGRRGAFYRPTGEKDFVLAATASSGSNTFLDDGPDLADDFGSVDFGANPAAIEVCMTSGTRLHRLITDISSSGGNSQVTVNANWPTDLTAATVARISWMPLVRFASDELTTIWRTPLSASIRCNFQSVRG